MHLELNEENVMRIYNDCLVTEADLPLEDSDVLASKIFVVESCGKDSPTIFFKKAKIREHSDTIEYLYGQLCLVHLHSLTMEPAMGTVTYQAKSWTGDTSVLMEFYYLGVANITIMPFILDPYSKAIVTDLIGIEPTYSPNDPKYKKEIS